jgi:Raf kinase inhibitor-like YbhB/YbcL family protein
MRPVAPFIALALALCLHVGCGGEEEPGFTLTSEAFAPNEPIPARHTCDGSPVPDVSPPLAWERPPAATESFALVVDSRSGEFVDDPQVLWVVFNIPVSLTQLSENIGHRSDLPDGAKPGRNHEQKPEYKGPCPPRGEAYSYRHWLYALDGGLDIGYEPTAFQLREAMEGHVLDTAMLIGQYGR